MHLWCVVGLCLLIPTTARDTTLLPVPDAVESGQEGPRQESAEQPPAEGQTRAALGPHLFDALLRYNRMRTAGIDHGESKIEAAAASLAAMVAATVRDVPTPVANATAAIGSAVALPLYMDPARCYGMKPCLHTTALERVQRGCLDAVWSGTWAIGLQSARAMADNNRLKGINPLIEQKFTPLTDCDTADVLLLSPQHSMRGDHVSVAQEEHTLLRLEGLKGKLWLMIGTSIDFNALKLACAIFGEEETLAHRPGSQFKTHWCHMKPLGLTLAYFFGNGLATVRETVSTRRPTRQERDATARGLDAELRVRGWAAGPDFVSLSGIEWDFQHWYYTNQTPWVGDAEGLVDQQIEAVHAQWPRVRAILLRTMFRSTYKGFSMGDATMYRQYNDAMRHLVGRQRQWETPAAGGSVRSRRCNVIGVLDLPSLMNYSAATGRCVGGNPLGQGTCSSMSGWTEDGLHPPPWVLSPFLSLSLNVLSDYADVCSTPSSPTPSSSKLTVDEASAGGATAGAARELTQREARAGTILGDLLT